MKNRKCRGMRKGSGEQPVNLCEQTKIARKLSHFLYNKLVRNFIQRSEIGVAAQGWLWEQAEFMA